jgi:hypothetical protein
MLAWHEALKFAAEEKKPMNNITPKTFKVHEDQKEIVEAALADIKSKTGTAVDTVAVEYMAQSYMGSGISFPDAKSALTAAYKKAGTAETFVGKVGEWLSDITGQPISIAIGD